LTTTEIVGSEGSESRSHLAEHTRAMWIPSVGILAVLYFLYVFHYAVNVPYGDDWTTVSLVDAAIHGHLTLGTLWAQYGSTRIFLPRLLFVAFGTMDHLDEKTIMLFSAAIFIVGFVILLLLFRSYIGRRLTFLPVLALGTVWFSLVDVQNSLWSFQLAWYLVLVFFVMMAYVLLLPNHHRPWFFGLGIFASIAASLSLIQGFVLWPVGLICLLWKRPWARRTYTESAIWISVAAITALIYMRGYSSALSQRACGVQLAANCSIRSSLHHPLEVAGFILALIGNVVPTSVGNVVPSAIVDPHPADLGAHELLGLVLLVGAIFVSVQSFREGTRRNPLPLLLIVFALLFDLTISLGRAGEGLAGAVNNDRFTMPNIVLLVGIAVYAWVHTPSDLNTAIGQRGPVRLIGWGGLAAIVAVYGVTSTRFGIVNGGLRERIEVTDARVVVNLDEIPKPLQGCYANFGVWQGALGNYYGLALNELELFRNAAVRDRLSVFGPGAGARLYRAEGPPTISKCG